MTCSDTLSPGASAAAAPFVRDNGGLPQLVVSVAQTVKLWQKRRHNREKLRALPEYLLRDIGIDAATARFEADKPFWRS
jgi:uncharacterized protein YjiS (DUF1127 family)